MQWSSFLWLLVRQSGSLQPVTLIRAKLLRLVHSNCFSRIGKLYASNSMVHPSKIEIRIVTITFLHQAHSFLTFTFALLHYIGNRKSCMQRLRVAYNFGCRALYNLPWRASVSSHQVQCNIPTCEALLRKYKYLFLERCRKSNNLWLRALM